MGKVKVDISMSLDGFVAGPNHGLDHPLGEGGDRLHEWVYGLKSWREAHGKTGGETGPDSDVSEEHLAGVGAVVMGKGMYGGWWGDESWEGWWGDDPPFHVPVFVLTHQARGPLTKSDTTYTFVTDGIESAMRQARAAAGDKDVLVSGGGTVVQQALRAGLVDELQVHVAPVLMGDGAPLFGLLRAGQIELEPVRVVDSPKVTHLKYRVVK
jgi:dihydrofolate reductase